MTYSAAIGASSATTCAPCAAGSISPAGSSACSKLQSYQIAHTPPEYNSGYAFVEVLVDDDGHWAAPDRQGTQYAGGGDPSFFFVLDLGTNVTVQKLVIRNHYWSGYYNTQSFSISMSLDSATNGFGQEVTGLLEEQDSSLQEVPVGLTGRYLKFKCDTYGTYSAGLKYVAVHVEKV